MVGVKRATLAVPLLLLHPSEAARHAAGSPTTALRGAGRGNGRGTMHGTAAAPSDMGRALVNSRPSTLPGGRALGILGMGYSRKCFLEDPAASYDGQHHKKRGPRGPEHHERGTRTPRALSNASSRERPALAGDRAGCPELLEYWPAE